MYYNTNKVRYTRTLSYKKKSKILLTKPSRLTLTQKEKHIQLLFLDITLKSVQKRRI